MMDRNVAYIVPLTVLGLVGGSIQAWNALHPDEKGSAPFSQGGLPEPGAVAYPPPEVRERGSGMAPLLKRVRRQLQEERSRRGQLQEQGRADRRELEQAQAEWQGLVRRLADGEDTVRQLRRQVALLEAVIQAGEEWSRPPEESPATLRPVSDPARSSVWEEAARQSALKGLYREAGEAFSRALRWSPADPVLHQNLGLPSEEILGEPGRALYHYGQFLSLAPEDPRVPAIRRRMERMGEGS